MKKIIYINVIMCLFGNCITMENCINNGQGLQNIKNSVIVEQHQGQDQQYKVELFRKIEQTESQIIDEFLDKCTDIDNFIDGENALMLASRLGKLVIVLQLLEKGANPNIQNEKGITPLMVALQNKQNEVAHTLVLAGGKLNIQNIEGNTALSYVDDENVKNSLLKYYLNCVYHKGDIATINWIIKEGKDMEIHIDELLARDFKDLEYSIDNGNVKIVEKILKSGVDPNVQNTEGTTPLIMALNNKQFDIAYLIVSLGGRLNIANVKGKTALSYVDDENVRSQLFVYSLCYACDHGDIETVNWVIKEDKNIEEDINKVSKEGRTALHYAVKNGNMKIFQKLLEHKADVNKKDKEEVTPLMVACIYGNIDIVRDLLQTNIDIDARTQYGQTALYVAVLNGERNIVRELLNKGSDPNIKNGKGVTPLMFALKKGYLDIAYNLLRLGGELNIKDSKNKDALSYLHINGAGKIKDKGVENQVKMLKAKKVLNRLFSESLLFASKNGNKETINWIIENYKGNTQCIKNIKHKLNQGIKNDQLKIEDIINKVSKEGKTALDYARTYGDADIVQILESVVHKAEG